MPARRLRDEARGDVLHPFVQPLRRRPLHQALEPVRGDAAEHDREAREARPGAGVVAERFRGNVDAAAARETRSKVEKLGLKTYTQVVETASGSRTRVRVGPFASRDEADRALAKAREAGISAVVLTL